MFLILYWSMFLFAVSSAQFLHLGNCPSVTPMMNFDANKIVGMWYEVQRYSSVYEYTEKCNRVNITRIDPNQIKIDVLAIVANSGAVSQWEVTGHSLPDSSSAQWNLTFPKYSEFHNAQLFILDTDYETYFVGFMCQFMDGISQMYVWIFSRETHLNKMTLAHAHKILREQFLLLHPLENVEQINCPP